MPSNPFEGDAAVRIEKAVRHAVTTQHVFSVGDVLIALRMDHNLSNEDFSEFFRALLEARLGFAVERWVMAIIAGDK